MSPLGRVRTAARFRPPSTENQRLTISFAVTRACGLFGPAIYGEGVAQIGAAAGGTVTWRFG